MNTEKKEIYATPSQEFKVAVYQLAAFNATLTKGYCEQWKDCDYEGYKEKKIKLQALVDTALKSNFPVFYDRRVNVVYFLFGEIQISFHTGGGYVNKESFGLPHTEVKWDGVKNAHTYTEKEYIALKEYRKEELARRMQALKEKENQIKAFADKFLAQLTAKLKRARSERSKNEIQKEIDSIAKMDAYQLSREFRYNEEAKDICNALSSMYCDNYIYTFSV